MYGGRDENLFLADLKLPFRQLQWLSIPNQDVRWRKSFRVDLTAAGGADPDAVVLIGIVDDPNNPQGEIIIEDIRLEPDDIFSFRNVVIETTMRTGGNPEPFEPEERAQQTADIAVTGEFMNPIDFLIGNNQIFAMRFLNNGVGVAGYEGLITGRILRDPSR